MKSTSFWRLTVVPVQCAKNCFKALSLHQMKRSSSRGLTMHQMMSQCFRQRLYALPKVRDARFVFRLNITGCQYYEAILAFCVQHECLQVLTAGHDAISAVLSTAVGCYAAHLRTDTTRLTLPSVALHYSKKYNYI